MKDERLQLRVDRRLKERMEKLAKRRATTLSALVTRYFQNLLEADMLERRANTQDGEAEQI